MSLHSFRHSSSFHLLFTYYFIPFLMADGIIDIRLSQENSNFTLSYTQVVNTCKFPLCFYSFGLCLMFLAFHKLLNIVRTLYSFISCFITISGLSIHKCNIDLFHNSSFFCFQRYKCYSVKSQHRRVVLFRSLSSWNY